ncbi:MAG: hypothetical protein WBN04_06445 [Paracoccaceae bacterium]
MTRIIVHAGFHKTGTTSLQDFFKQNRAALEPWLSYYGKADFRMAGAHARVYGQHRYWWRRLMFRRAFRRFLTGLPDAHTIVLSRETFAGAMPGHRRFGGRQVESYAPAAIPLAREIVGELRDRFGPEVTVEFLYTLRDRDSWLASVHGHLLRSINLRADLAGFRAGFRTLPDPARDAQRIAAALAPIPVHIAWLEDYADLPEGPAGAVLDLIGFPVEMLDMLKPAPHGNPGQPDDLRERFRALNLKGGRRHELKAAKEALLAASRQKP